MSVYSLAKHNRPLSDYMWMCKLKKKLSPSLGSTYRTKKSAAVFRSSIVAVEFKHVGERVTSAADEELL